MNKNSNLIDLKNFAKRFRGILIDDMEDFMKVSKKNKNAKLLAVVPKCKKPPVDELPDWFKPYAQKIDFLMQERNQAPEWFKPYAQKIDLLMQERNQAPKWFEEFSKKQEEFNTKQEANWEEQKEFNKSIINRLDNIVKLNNLKE